MTPRTRLAVLLLALPTFAACEAGEIGDDEEEAAIDSALRQCASGPTVPGVDVSYYQGNIDWATLKASGREFAFVRVSDGARRIDPKWDRNWSGVAEVGLYRGAYQYFRASQDPIAQADLLLEKIGGVLGDHDLPPALDLEESDGMRASVVRQRAQQWIDHVEAALGRKPLIYTGAGYMDAISNPAELADNPLWVANWQARCPRMPRAWEGAGWKVWQTRIAPRVPGIRGPVDVNLFNGTVAELAAFSAGN